MKVYFSLMQMFLFSSKEYFLISTNDWGSFALLYLHACVGEVELGRDRWEEKGRKDGEKRLLLLYL